MADLFDIVVARKLSGGGGGGGSSDFSTANVTIIDTVGNIFNVVDMRVPYIRVAPMITPPVECIWDSLWDKTGTVNLEVVLYKGNAVFMSGATSDVTTTVTSGNAEVVTFSDEWGTYADVIIKGDCTITLSSPT